MPLAALLGGSVASFLGVGALFGGAAAMTGQALARNWRPAWQLLPYALLLAVGDRFLLFALFDGTMLAAGGYGIAALLLLAMALAAYRATRARCMVAQYPWLYERAGLLSWRDRR